MKQNDSFPNRRLATDSGPPAWWIGLPAILIGLVTSISVNAQPRLVGGPCEGCEAVLEYSEIEGVRPLSPNDTLTGFETAEQKLLVRGTVYEPDGETPAEDVILYVHHTNEEGVYPTRGDEYGWGSRHGYIRGWIRTGPDGRYSFHTQMPGRYGSEPAHIHPFILEPDGRYYYLTSYFFAGDPRLDESDREGRGGNAVVELGTEDGMLVAERDIVLGLNVPGYDDAR